MSHLIKLSDRYLEVAQCAISDKHFTGEDVRFSSEYEALEQELVKGHSLHASSPVDWLKVLHGSEALLRSQSKDLRVAGWMAWALYQRESFAGLVAGLGAILHLCTRHWAALHPHKARTRIAAIDWLLSRMEPVLNENIAIKDQLALFRRLLQQLEALDKVFSEHLDDNAPLLLPLCRRLANMIRRAQDDSPQPGVVEAVANQVRQVASQLLAPVAVIDNDKDARKALRLLQDSARPLCVWWLKQQATDLRALCLNRALLWLPIEVLPERNAERITALRGLPADKLKNYQERFMAGHYADLLVELDASLARAPFWFDGQRMVWDCLQQLGAEQAMREVEFHFALLLQRLPTLIELRFHDGTPFADPATRAWITRHVLTHLQAPASAPVAATGAVPVWEQALQAVMPILLKDGLKAAVQQFRPGLDSAQGGRNRFFWQLSLARLCFEARQYELARIQLESLDQVLQQTGLQAWEPDLLLQVLRLMHGCCELLPQNHAVRERKEEIYRRLCHLDLEVVLE
ncbi:type VI secretion system protein TssA [Pseudomonas sp. 3A(2025)]